MVGFYNYTVWLTYVGLVGAVTGIVFASEGNVSAAVVCLLIAGFCDLFDGTVARTKERTEREKGFGIQIDSLSDIVNFGVLPAMIGHAVGMTAWYQTAVLCVYVLAALIRLGYYNVTEEELSRSETPVKRTHYEGLPVTTATILFPMLFLVKSHMADSAFAMLYTVWMLLAAAAFLIKFRVRKLKMRGMLLAAAVGAAVLILLLFMWK